MTQFYVTGRASHMSHIQKLVQRVKDIQVQSSRSACAELANSSAVQRGRTFPRVTAGTVAFPEHGADAIKMKKKARSQVAKCTIVQNRMELG